MEIEIHWALGSQEIRRSKENASSLIESGLRVSVGEMLRLGSDYS